MINLRKIGGLVEGLIDGIDAVSGLVSLSRIKKLTSLISGKKESGTTSAEPGEKSKDEIKSDPGDIGRNDEIIKSNLMMKLSPRRRAACLAFINWMSRKKGAMKARLFRKHFNEEFEADQRNALRKIEYVIDIILSDPKGHEIAFEYCEDMEYTKDSTIEFLKFAKGKSFKALSKLDGTVGKDIRKKATSFKNNQKKKLEIERLLREQRGR